MTSGHLGEWISAQILDIKLAPWALTAAHSRAVPWLLPVVRVLQ
jgi:hypothetical protein